MGARYFLRLFLGLVSVGFLEGAGAMQSQGSSEKKAPESKFRLFSKKGKEQPPKDSTLKLLTEKVRWREELSPQETVDYHQELARIEKKLKDAGNDKSQLTTDENNLISWIEIYKITPSIENILKEGKKFDWGIALDLLEQRGAKARHLTNGAAELSSVVSTYQKKKEKEEGFRKEIREAQTEIEQINEDAIKKREAAEKKGYTKKALNDEIQRIVEEADKLKAKHLKKLNDNKTSLSTLEQAEKSISRYTKLPIETIRKLPIWKKKEQGPAPQEPLKHVLRESGKKRTQEPSAPPEHEDQPPLKKQDSKTLSLPPQRSVPPSPVRTRSDRDSSAPPTPLKRQDSKTGAN